MGLLLVILMLAVAAHGSYAWYRETVPTQRLRSFQFSLGTAVALMSFVSAGLASLRMPSLYFVLLSCTLFPPLAMFFLVFVRRGAVIPSACLSVVASTLFCCLFGATSATIELYASGRNNRISPDIASISETLFLEGSLASVTGAFFSLIAAVVVTPILLAVKRLERPASR